ncbi:MAG: FtsW/RodA/SpoVE family cell cycle protein [bacterium]
MLNLSVNFRNVINRLNKCDWLIPLAALSLFSIGCVSLYYNSTVDRDVFSKQVTFLAISVVLFYVLIFSDWRVFRDNSYLVLFIYFIAVTAVLGLFFFAPDIRGVKNWYRIDRISIDPVELLKLSLVFLLAKYFSMRHVEMYRVRHIIASSVYVIIPAAMLILQSNMGAVIAIFSLWGGVLIFSGIKLRQFVMLVFAGIIIVTIAWGTVLKDYQRERILSFISPNLEPLGIGWSQSQAKISIGSGGLLGLGLGRGPQTQLGYLTESHTDFIFAAIGEEAGFLGAILIIAIYALLIWRIINVALKVSGNFPRLVVSGIAVVLCFQFIVNVGMNLGLMPIVGISLPLVSYGGSNLIATFASLGIIESIRADS